MEGRKGGREKERKEGASELADHEPSLLEREKTTLSCEQDKTGRLGENRQAGGKVKACQHYSELSDCEAWANPAFSM